MTWLSRLPKLVPFLILLTLLVSGVLSSNVLGFHVLGFVLMSLAALFVAWVLYLSWPRLTSSERVMRVAILLLALAMALVQLSPRR